MGFLGHQADGVIDFTTMTTGGTQAAYRNRNKDNLKGGGVVTNVGVIRNVGEGGTPHLDREAVKRWNEAGFSFGHASGLPAEMLLKKQLEEAAAEFDSVHKAAGEGGKSPRSRYLERQDSFSSTSPRSASAYNSARDNGSAVSSSSLATQDIHKHVIPHEVGRSHSPISGGMLRRMERERERMQVDARARGRLSPTVGGSRSPSPRPASPGGAGTGASTPRPFDTSLRRAAGALWRVSADDADDYASSGMRSPHYHQGGMSPRGGNSRRGSINGEGFSITLQAGQNTAAAKKSVSSKKTAHSTSKKSAKGHTAAPSSSSSSSASSASLEAAIANLAATLAAATAKAKEGAAANGGAIDPAAQASMLQAAAALQALLPASATKKNPASSAATPAAAATATTTSPSSPKPAFNLNFSKAKTLDAPSPSSNAVTAGSPATVAADSVVAALPRKPSLPPQAFSKLASLQAQAPPKPQGVGDLNLLGTLEALGSPSSGAPPRASPSALENALNSSGSSSSKGAAAAGGDSDSASSRAALEAEILALEAFAAALPPGLGESEETTKKMRDQRAPILTW
jgi:hypothetical protein